MPKLGCAVRGVVIETKPHLGLVAVYVERYVDPLAADGVVLLPRHLQVVAVGRDLEYERAVAPDGGWGAGGLLGDLDVLARFLAGDGALRGVKLRFHGGKVREYLGVRLLDRLELSVEHVARGGQAVLRPVDGGDTNDVEQKAHRNAYDEYRAAAQERAALGQLGHTELGL